MATAAEVSSAIIATQAVGDSILQTIEAVDPTAQLPAAEAGAILDLVAAMVSKAITAYSAAAGTPITAASILALLPNSTPLTAPDA